jgi:protein-disulfide isomerase
VKRSTKIQIAIITGVLVILAGTVAVFAANQPRADTATQTQTPIVAESSHRLDDAGEGAVTFTEFVDFECEVCGAVYPYVEELREEYAGRVTFVARYFPLPGHFNSRTAAIAVEAAAQQGKFEEMYHRMFETQAQWGEQQVTAAPLFRGFATEIGLDLDAYDRAIADPATEARVQADYDAAIALGATGTPTIFINDAHVPLTSPDDLRQALGDAVAEAAATNP